MVNFKKMAKKGQNAVPVILISMAILMFVYFVMVSSSERALILQGNESNETISKSPLGEDTKLIFSSGEISEIGSSFGESVFKFRLRDVNVDYGTVEKILSSEYLNSKISIFSGDSVALSANNLNLDNTKEVIVRLNVTELKGAPTIEVYLNNSKMLEKTLQTGEFDITISKELLLENNPITIKIKHAGAFWTSQAVDMNIEIVQVFYNPSNPIDEQILTLGQSNMQGNEVKISFVPKIADNQGELIVKINDKILFSGIAEENQSFSYSARVEESEIKVGDNKITFEAGAGGIYSLGNVSFEFIAVATPATKKVYSFNIERTDLASGRDFVIGIKTDRIIKPGVITAKLEEGGPTYYFNNTDLASGAWTYTKLNRAYLNELGNKLTLDSPNGRYRINGFTIILV